MTMETKLKDGLLPGQVTRPVTLMDLRNLLWFSQEPASKMVLIQCPVSNILAAAMLLLTSQETLLVLQPSFQSPKQRTRSLHSLVPSSLLLVSSCSSRVQQSSITSSASSWDASEQLSPSCFSTPPSCLKTTLQLAKWLEFSFSV